jgi:hypothetical protein
MSAARIAELMLFARLNSGLSMNRIVGYFSKISGWNLSKLAELRARQHGDYAVKNMPAEEEHKDA